MKKLVGIVCLVISQFANAQLIDIQKYPLTWRYAEVNTWINSDGEILVCPNDYTVDPSGKTKLCKKLKGKDWVDGWTLLKDVKMKGKSAKLYTPSWRSDGNFSLVVYFGD